MKIPRAVKPVRARRAVRADAYTAPYFGQNTNMETMGNPDYREDPAIHSTDQETPLENRDQANGDAKPPVESEDEASRRNAILTNPIPLVISAPGAIEKMEELNKMIGEDHPALAAETAAVAQALETLEHKAVGDTAPPADATGAEPIANTPGTQPGEGDVSEFKVGDRVQMQLTDGKYNGEVQAVNADGTLYTIKTDQMATFTNVPAASLGPSEQLSPIQPKASLNKGKTMGRKAAKKPVVKAADLEDGVPAVIDPAGVATPAPVATEMPVTDRDALLHKTIAEWAQAKGIGVVPSDPDTAAYEAQMTECLEDLRARGVLPEPLQVLLPAATAVEEVVATPVAEPVAAIVEPAVAEVVPAGDVTLEGPGTAEEVTIEPDLEAAQKVLAFHQVAGTNKFFVVLAGSKTGVSTPSNMVKLRAAMKAGATEDQFAGVFDDQAKADRFAAIVAGKPMPKAADLLKAAVALQADTVCDECGKFKSGQGHITVSGLPGKRFCSDSCATVAQSKMTGPEKAAHKKEHMLPRGSQVEAAAVKAADGDALEVAEQVSKAVSGGVVSKDTDNEYSFPISTPNLGHECKVSVLVKDGELGVAVNDMRENGWSGDMLYWRWFQMVGSDAVAMAADIIHDDIKDIEKDLEKEQDNTPSEDDITIGKDDLSAFSSGKQIVKIGREEADREPDALYKAIAAWMKKNNFFPNVWDENGNNITESVSKGAKSPKTNPGEGSMTKKGKDGKMVKSSIAAKQNFEASVRAAGELGGKTPDELKSLIENWKNGLSKIPDGPGRAYVTSRISEAEQLLQQKMAASLGTDELLVSDTAMKAAAMDTVYATAIAADLKAVAPGDQVFIYARQDGTVYASQTKVEKSVIAEVLPVAAPSAVQPAVLASAFDKIEELEIGGGMTARRKGGKKEEKPEDGMGAGGEEDGKGGKKEKAAEIEVMDKDGKVVETFPDAFGDDTVTIIKFLRQVLDIKDDDKKDGEGKGKDGDKPAAGKKEDGDGEAGPKKPKAEKPSVVDQPMVLPKVDKDKADLEAAQKLEAKAMEVRAARVQARIDECREIVAALVSKGHVVVAQADIDAELLKGSTLRDAQAVAARCKIDAEVMDLLAKPDAELRVLKASLANLPVRQMKVHASMMSGLENLVNLSASGLIHEENRGAAQNSGIGLALSAAFSR